MGIENVTFRKIKFSTFNEAADYIRKIEQKRGGNSETYVEN